MRSRKCIRNMHKRYILVTGAGSGIGRATAKLFAKQGDIVYGGYRSAKAGDRTDGFHHCVLDVTNVESIERLVQTMPRIDIVIHCAGFGICGAAEDAAMEAVRLQMETNYFGVLQVNQQVLPRMRSQGGGLVIVIGSVAGIMAIPFQSHYSSSKYALEAYVEALRMEAAPFGIRACLIEPGDTCTGFTDSRMKGLTAASPYYEQCKRSVNKMEYDERHGKAPETVARTALQLSYRRHVPIRMTVGWDYKAIVMAKRLLPAAFVEKLLKSLYC